jgi:DNA-binding GntR family transcriptional regulator
LIVSNFLFSVLTFVAMLGSLASPRPRCGFASAVSLARKGMSTRRHMMTTKSPVGPALELSLHRKFSLTAIIRKEIERMIEAGELNPGDWVNEAMLASRLSVSRGPVREACRGLEQSGLLQVIVNRGVFVRKVENQEAAELYDLRAALFGLAGKTLAPTITEAQLTTLRGILNAMDRAAAGKGDLSKYYPLNLEFHRKLLEFAGNSRLLAAYQSFIQELHLFRRSGLVSAGRMAESNREHRAIVEALAKRDPRAASRLMEAHVLDAKRRIH